MMGDEKDIHERDTDPAPASIPCGDCGGEGLIYSMGLIADPSRGHPCPGCEGTGRLLPPTEPTGKEVHGKPLERHAISTCPHCGEQLGQTANMTGEQLGPGSLTICIFCCSPLRFVEGMQLEAVDIDDMPPVARAEFRKVVEAIRKARAEQKQGGKA